VKKNGSGLFLRAGEVVVSPKLTAILGKSPRGHGSRRFLDKVICDFLAPFGSFSKEKKWKERNGMGLSSLLIITLSLYFHFGHLMQFQSFKLMKFW
jgi:hypothetical protein